MAARLDPERLPAPLAEPPVAAEDLEQAAPAAAEPAARPRKRWSELTSEPDFQTLSSAEQEEVRNAYFERVIAPGVGAADRLEARRYFDEQSRPGKLARLGHDAKRTLDTAADAVGPTVHRGVAAAGELLGRARAKLTEPGPAPAMGGGARADRPATGAGNVDIRRQFADAMTPFAVQASERTGIPVDVLLAHASLETDWGRRAPGNNYFGIKGPGQKFATHEVIGGRRVAMTDSFRAYNDPSESFNDLADLLIRRYPQAIGAKNAREYGEALKAGGYATDPRYVEKMQGRHSALVRGLSGAGEATSGGRFADKFKQVLSGQAAPARDSWLGDGQRAPAAGAGEPAGATVPKELYGLPLKSGYIDAVRAEYDAASPAQRAALLARGDVKGRVAQFIHQGYQQADRLGAQDPELLGVGTRREDREQGYLNQGMDARSAQAMADRDLQMGLLPGGAGEAATPEWFRSTRPTLGQTAGIEAQRGMKNLEAIGAGLGAWGADALGLGAGLGNLEPGSPGEQRLAQSFQQDYNRLTDEAERSPPVIGDFANIDTSDPRRAVADATRYGVEMVMGNLPMFLPSLGTGVVTGAIARRAATKAVEGLVEKLGAARATQFLAEKAAAGAQGFGKIGATAEAVAARNAAQLAQQGVTQAAARIAPRAATGAAIGAGLGAVGMETGSIYGDIAKETGQQRPGVAAVAGLAAGALDAIPAWRAAAKLVGPAVAEEIAGTVMQRLGKEAGIQFLAGGGTEFVQTLIENGAVHHVQGQPYVNAQDVHEALNAAIGGGLAGGLIGGATQGWQEATRPPSQAAQLGRALQDRVDEVRLGFVDQRTGETLSDAELASRRLSPDALGQPEQAPGGVRPAVVPPRAASERQTLPEWTANLPQESGYEPNEITRPGTVGAAGPDDRAAGGADLLSFAPDFGRGGAGDGDGGAVGQPAEPAGTEPGAPAPVAPAGVPVSGRGPGAAVDGVPERAAGADDTGQPAAEDHPARGAAADDVSGSDAAVDPAERQKAESKAIAQKLRERRAALPRLSYDGSWDRLEPAQRAELVRHAGWAQPDGQLNAFGAKLVNTPWQKLSKASRDKLMRHYQTGESAAEQQARLDKDFATGGLKGEIETAVTKRNLGFLSSWLGNLDNQRARGHFEQLTGVELPKTKGGTLQALDDWAGVAPEQRAQLEQAKAERIEQGKAQRRFEAATRVLESRRMQDGMTLKDSLDQLMDAGYTELQAYPRGAATRYVLAKPGDPKVARLHGRGWPPAADVKAYIEGALQARNQQENDKASGGPVETAVNQPREQSNEGQEGQGQGSGQERLLSQPPEQSPGASPADAGAIKGQEQEASAEAVKEPIAAIHSGESPQWVEHTTAKGKVLRGIVRKDITVQEAKQIDPFTFRKDGGFFIREKFVQPAANAAAAPAGGAGIMQPVTQGNADSPEHAYSAYDAVAREYGFSVGADGVISKGDKPTAVVVQTKKGRLLLRNKENDALLASYAGSPAKLATFLEEFWYAEKSKGAVTSAEPNAAGVDRQGSAPVTQDAAPSEQPASVPAPADAPQAAERPADYGSNNKVFTKERAERAREILRRKLNQVNAGFDPEIAAAGLELAGYHIEAGAREFAAFTKAMVADIGEAVRPYLRSFYESARHAPGLDNTGMTSGAEIDALLAADAEQPAARPEPPAVDKTPPVVDTIQEAAGQSAPDNQVEEAQDAGRDTNRADGGAGPAGAGAGAVSGAGESGEPATVPGGQAGGDRGTGKRTVDAGADADRPVRPGAPGARPAANLGSTASVGTGGTSVPDLPRDTPRGDDYRIAPGAIAREGSWLDTARRNVEIVELVHRLEREGRPATADEQAQLAKFTGWGAADIRNQLFPAKAKSGVRYDPSVLSGSWRELGQRVAEVFTKDDWKTALRSTQYAHYTSETVVRAVWQAAERFGFAGGAVLEPGAGIGHFAGLMPDGIYRNSRYLGIEMDGFTARIAQLLYPGQTLRQGDYVKTKVPRGFFDLAIGNPPFAATAITDDPEYARQKFSLHDYFFAKTLDRVRPGGLLLFVTSRHTLDKQGDKARQYLADRADFLGAIRLPNTAFQANAGTQVVTDIIMLRKRDAGQAPAGEIWTGLGELQSVEGEPVPVNEYFARHPEMILGQVTTRGDTLNASERFTVNAHPGELGEQLAAALERLPQNVYSVAGPGVAAETARRAAVAKDFNPKYRKEGGIYRNDAGELLRVEQGVGVPLGDMVKLSAKDRAWLSDYVPLRDALKQAQYDQLHDGDWEASLRALNQAYDAFVAKHGQILTFTETETTQLNEDGEEETVVRRRYKNDRLLRQDVDGKGLLSALEKIQEDGTITKAAILQGRVLKRPARREIASVNDALAVSLAETGRFDLADVARLAGLDEAAALAQLGDLVYAVPGGGQVLADEYLSGDVKTKLDEAEAAAAIDRQFARNVEALTRVQPPALVSADVTVGLGATWVPKEYYQQFAREVVGLTNPRLTYHAATNEFVIEADERRQMSRNEAAEWGTAYRSPLEVLDAALNRRTVKVYTGRGTKDDPKVLNVEETQKVETLTRRLAEQFSSWVWTDAPRTEKLLDLYNDKFNRLAPRYFDGAHINPPGLSLRYKLHPHQKRAIWRAIQTGNTYFAHAVGAGKTLEMIIAGMEQKRLGLINKPMYVVPGHMLEQFAAEFLDAYPAANIMVADEENFAADNRRRFIAQAALNSPDAIIITHSAFTIMEMRPENQAAAFDDVLDDLRGTLEDLPDDFENRKTRSKIEAQLERIERAMSGASSERMTQRNKLQDWQAARREVEKAIADLSPGQTAQLKEQQEKLAKIDAEIAAQEPKARKEELNAERDKAVLFEDMGVDFLFVDEAHEFRKLDYATKMTIKGLSPEGSVKALKLFVKTRWLEKQRPGRAFAFASGTPITNTLAELYTIQRFFHEQELRDKGLIHFDAWAAQFAQVKTEYERNATGKIEAADRLSKFVNVADLMAMVRQQMDVLTSSELAHLVKLPTPVPGNAGKREIIVTPQTEALAEYMGGELSRRLEASREWKPTKEQPNNPDPVINIITDGRVAALDMRYINPSLPNDPDSKLNQLAERMIAHYQATADLTYTDPETGQVEPVKGGTQIVFASLGFGPNIAKTRGFDGRAWINQRLRAAGIPAHEVAWIWDYPTAAAKQAMFKEMRQGKKRILIGSPKNMGTGVNVQKRLTHKIDLDAPWYPSDLEQPDGRILRQGNQNEWVTLEGLAAEGTYDSTMYGMVARKAGFIEQAFRGDRSLRVMDDISAASTYAMAAAIASGDPRYMQLTELESTVTKLETEKELHERRQSALRAELSHFKGNGPILRERIQKAERVQQALEGLTFYSGYFDAVVGGQTLPKVRTAELGEAIAAAVDEEFAAALETVQQAALNDQRPSKDKTGGPVHERVYEKVIGTVGGGRAELVLAVQVDAWRAKDGNGQLTDSLQSKHQSARVHLRVAGETFYRDIDRWQREQAPNRADSAGRAVTMLLSRQQHAAVAEARQAFADNQDALEKAERAFGVPFPRQAALVQAVTDLANLRHELTSEGKEVPEAAVKASVLPDYSLVRPLAKGGDRQSGYLAAAYGWPGVAADEAQFSRAGGDAALSRARMALGELAKHDELFQLPKPESVRVADIAREIDPAIRAREVVRNGRWEVTMPGGAVGVLRRDRDGKLYLDASRLEPGVSQGYKLYAIAAAYAHNNGLVFKGDPNGLSKMAMIRRTENMLSSALKYGTTRHLEPHPSQNIEWDPADEGGNLERLLAASYRNAVEGWRTANYSAIPELDDITFNFDSGRFEYVDTGAEVTNDDFNDIAEQHRAAPPRFNIRRGESPARAGSASVKRAALIGALLRGARGEVPGGGRRGGGDALLAAAARERGTERLDAGLPGALREIFYRRGAADGAGAASRFGTLERSADQSAAAALNAGLAKHFNDPRWEHAYVQWDLPDSLAEFADAAKTAFGAEVVGIRPRHARFDQFDGINYRGRNYINLNAEPGFINVAGHEIGHQLKKDRPDLYQWFANHARRHYRDLPAYRDKLNALLGPGERPYNLAAVEEELLSDFMGDALADPAFVQRLAQADPGRFRQLLNAVVRWLKEFGRRLTGQGLGSSQYFHDVETLREFLAEALVAYGRGGPVAVGKLEGPRFHQAWHGSPHDFDRFSLDKIGSGEGAQAFGYGLYFTNARDIAEWYKESLSEIKVTLDGQNLELSWIGGKPQNITLEEELAADIANHAIANNLDVATARTRLADIYSSQLQRMQSDLEYFKDDHEIIREIEGSIITNNKAIKILKHFDPSRLSINKGAIYQVELAPQEDEYLDWHKPLSEQSEKVREAFRQADDRLVYGKDRESIPQWLEMTGQLPPHLSNDNGWGIYAEISKQLGSDRAASEYLHSLGIRGIRYPAEGMSGGKSGDRFNYVIFSDDDVAITAKFSRSRATREAYERRIDELLGGATPEKATGIRVLDRSDLLDMLGFGSYEVVLAEAHAVADGMYNHGLTANEWKKIPDWIDDPVAVFERADGNLTFIGPETKQGFPLIIGIKPDIGTQRNSGRLHVLLTAYHKDAGRLPIARMLREGGLRFVNLRKSPGFNRHSGLRLPSSAIDLKGLPNKVATERGLVKYRATNPPVDESLTDDGINFSRRRPPREILEQAPRPPKPDKVVLPEWDGTPEQAFALVDAAVREGDGWAAFKRELADRWAGLTGTARRQALGALTVHQLVEVGQRVLPRMTDYLKEMTAMDATRNRVLHEVDGIAKDWEKLGKPTMARLALVMHESTLAGVDGAEPFAPSLDLPAAVQRIGVLKNLQKGAPGDRKVSAWQAEIGELRGQIAHEHQRREAYQRIKALYGSLPRPAQEIYRRARDYHVAQSRRVEAALVAMIEKTHLTGASRAAAVTQLRQEFEAQRVNAPYFPLARQGDYWVSVRPAKVEGQRAGANEFHMFQTYEAQQRFIDEARADGLTVLGHGKQLENLQEVVGVSGSFVAQVEDILSQLPDGPMVQSARDAVYQLYLQTLPDLSARKHFIHRKKTPGFGTDALRAFAHKGYHDAYQYARVQHGFELRTVMEQLREDVATAASEAKLQAARARLALLEEFREEVLDAGIGFAAVKDRADRAEFGALESGAQANGRSLTAGERFVKDEAAKWRQFLEWMQEWTKYGGIPDRIQRERREIELRLESADKINAMDRGREFAADITNELQQAQAWLMNPRTAAWATWLNQLGYLWNLAFSPSAWVTNATQNPLVAMPYVAARHGMGPTRRAFTEAYRQAFRGALKKDPGKQHRLGIYEALTDPDELEAYEQALDSGVIERGRAMDLAGVAEEGQARSGWHRKFATAMTVGFHDVEMLNRETTFMAAYRLARRSGEGFQAAVDYAGQAVNKTHLVYSAENRPRFMRPDVARVALQFKLYSQGISYLLGKAVLDSLGKGASAQERAEARRFLALQLGMQSLAAGALGLPIGLAWWGAQAAFAALFDDDDEPKDLEPEFRQALAELLGKTGGEAAAKGPINALSPIDIHSRVGMRELWFRENDRDVEGKDAATQLLSNALGPIAGIAEGLAVGAKLIGEGHWWRGIEKMTPKALRDPLKTLRYWDEGARTLKGDPLVEELTLGELIGQGLGFSPSRLNERYDENNAVMNRERRLEDRRRALAGGLAQARIEAAKAEQGGAADAYARALERFQATLEQAQRFNAKNPTLGVTGDTVGRSIRSRIRARAMAQHGIFPNRKIPGRYDYAEE